MALGAFNFKARLSSTILNFVLAFLNLFGAYRAFDSYNGTGAFCTGNTFMIVEYEGDGKFVEDGYTYFTDGATIYLLAVIQVVLGSIQVVFCGCPLFFTKVVKGKKKGSKKHKRRDSSSS